MVRPPHRSSNSSQPAHIAHHIGRAALVVLCAWHRRQTARGRSRLAPRHCTSRRAARLRRPRPAVRGWFGGGGGVQSCGVVRCCVVFVLLSVCRGTKGGVRLWAETVSFHENIFCHTLDARDMMHAHHQPSQVRLTVLIPPERRHHATRSACGAATTSGYFLRRTARPPHPPHRHQWR